MYAEDVPWTSVSNEGERVLFQEQSLYSNDRRREDLVSPSFEGRKHGGEDWGYLLRDSNFNYPSRTGVTIIATHTVGSSSWNSGNRVTDDVFNNLKKWSE
ncbi:glutamyl endopeptidase [Bacillus paranthracis]|nr:hypothetical protein [Bacillus paranthracis]ADY20074.1 extracellular metalloprotease [Bacillus thuringiensis serovar finitimus YBT-020]MDA1585956.1 glutamyl endopeptidase [Bacillus cereus group sp. TH230-1LC]MCR6799635.1 glutamyl endopeptidase [Bacillus paranthracis]MEC3356369.1 glutamyl endopeptidase [Bacillus paranthracis]MED0784268.1 glutamyl endopeptidase [Bacillus paranthracis]